MTMCLFGSTPIQCSELARRIVEFVRRKNLPESGKGSDTAWTSAVKEILREIGHERKFEVYPKPEGGEFLLDVIWWSDCGGIELGAESEWGQQPSAVLDDFQKLVCIKAQIKVMVYWLDAPRRGERILGQLVSYMEKYNKHVKGEEYVFVAFGAGADDHCYHYAVLQHGTNTAISPTEIQLNKAVGAVPI
jgi:hypothetical protein